MTWRAATHGLDFEALRLGIERCDPDLLLGFYAEDARLIIVSARAPKALPFELSGKAEIAKHLRATFVQGSLHRVEEEDFFGDGRITFREACQYPDGARLWVETTLRIHLGRIVRQVDVVANDPPSDCRAESRQRPPTQTIQRGDRPAVNPAAPKRSPRSEGATEKVPPPPGMIRPHEQKGEP
jgi:hypothetical protein